MPSGTFPRAPRSPRRSADPTSRSRVALTRSSRQRSSRSRARATGGVRRSPWPNAMAWAIGRYSRPRLGRSPSGRSGWESSTKERARSAAPGRSPSHELTRPPRCCCTMVTGQLHAARGQHQAALEAFAAGAQAQSLLTGVHAFATPVVGWLAATQARLGMPDEARETLTGCSAEPGGMGFIYNARAVICMAEGDPAAALDAVREVRANTPTAGPPFTLVEAHLLAGIAHLALDDRDAAAAAAEEALSAAEPDRLIFPFALTEAAELLDALPRHKTAHGALLADIVDVLQGTSTPSTDRDALVATGRAQPKRAARAALPADQHDAARDRARALRLHQHGQHAHSEHLRQARCARSLIRR